MTATRKYLLNK